MQRKLVLFVVPALVALSALAGCGSKDKGTNPMPTTEPFESGDLSNSAGFTHTFNTAGSFSYHCRHHNMSGVINVTAGAADSAFVQLGDNFFNPSTASIKPGARVRWKNGGAMVHTVSRP